MDRQLAARLLERQTAGGMRRLGRLDFPGKLAHRLLELGVVSRQGQSGAVLRQGLAKVPSSMIDLGQAANRGEIFARALEHQLELPLRIVQLIQFEEGASERDASGEVGGVNFEAGLADVDRLLELPGAPELLGELRKSNRRRILLDPASKVVDTSVVAHGSAYGTTVTVPVVDPVRPFVSVTIRVTVKVPAAA